MPRLATSRRQAAGCAPLPSAHTGSRYARHAPERTLLYALVEAHYPDFIARIEAEGRSLPGYVREAFDAYLRCGVLEHGFLRVVCEHCRAERLVAFSCKKRGFCPSCGARRMAESARHLVEEVFGPRPVRQWVLSFPYPLRFLFASKPEAIGPVLGIVQRVIAGWLADQAGIDRASAQCGAVTLIQRFGSALNLNIHFHMLWLDGVYVEATELPRRELRLHRARAPTTAQLTQLAATIAHRVCRHLTRKGWLEGEGESAFLADSAAGDDSMDGLRMSSITYRIATGRDAGCKVVTLQTLPGDAGSLEGEAGKVGGFSLHAGVAAEAHESHKREKLCRYITRPAISEKRLSIALQGRVRYQLKTPWRNGTTHVEWDPVDFIAKLAALVPPPRAHLTRFHGVFAPNANLRAQLTPSGRGKRPAGDAAPVDVSAHDAPRSPEEKRRAMSWAQRLKRVFSIDVTACVHCGGTVRIVASIEEPTAIRAILAHFEKHGAREEAHYRPAARAASASRVTICRLHSRRRNRNPSRCGHDPQGGARPAVGNQRSMAADNAAAWPRDAEIPLTDVRSVPKTGLARPPPTQQTARKGRLNFLYARNVSPAKSGHVTADRLASGCRSGSTAKSGSVHVRREWQSGGWGVPATNATSNLPARSCTTASRAGPSAISTSTSG